MFASGINWCMLRKKLQSLQRRSSQSYAWNNCTGCTCLQAVCASVPDVQAAIRRCHVHQIQSYVAHADCINSTTPWYMPEMGRTYNPAIIKRQPSIDQETRRNGPLCVPCIACVPLVSLSSDRHRPLATTTKVHVKSKLSCLDHRHLVDAFGWVVLTEYWSGRAPTTPPAAHTTPTP